MSRITDLLVEGLPKVVEDFNSRIGEPSHVISSRLDNDEMGNLKIWAYPKSHDIAQKSLIAVDGGNTMQQLAGGDLIVAGATVGQGANSKLVYEDEDAIPAEAYAAVLPHTSENSAFQGSIRSLMELRLLHSAKADIKIIDGAYLQHITNVLFTLVGDRKYAKFMLDHIRENDPDCTWQAMDSLLGVTDPDFSNNILAITKSDSSRRYTQMFFGDDTLMDDLVKPSDRYPGITDRILAARLLDGGQFFKPRHLIATRQIINKLAKMDVKKESKKFGADAKLFEKLVAGRAEQLDALDSRDESRSKLWTTYFKPHSWSRFEPAMKIEFTHNPADEKQSVAERAQELIGWVDQDIMGIEFLEPWCQYEADRLAKDVSLGTDILRGHLIDTIEDDQLAFGLLRNYRS